MPTPTWPLDIIPASHSLALSPVICDVYSLCKMQALSIAIAQQPLLAHLPAEPRVFNPAKEGAEIGPLKLVDPDAACFKAAGDAFCLLQIPRVDGGTEASVGEVRPGDDVIFGGPGEDGEDGTFFFLSVITHRVSKVFSLLVL